MKNNFPRLAPLVSALCLVCAAPVAVAQTIAISNFAEPPYLINGVPASDTISATHWEYQAFATTGSAWTGPLASIAIRNSGVAAPVYVAQLFQGTPESGSFGPLVGSFSLASDVGGIATFLPSGAFTLASNTTYSFVVGVTAGSFGWDAATNYNSTGGGTFPEYSWGFSDNSGVNWTANPNSLSLPQYIEVRTAAIPEPTTYGLLLGLATVGLCVVRRWRFARQVQVN